MKNYVLKIILVFFTIKSLFLPLFKLESLSRTENQDLRRVRTSLSTEARRLQQILDDETIEKIEDERLLVGGILDELLEIDKRYEDLYWRKATSKILEIYQRVKEGGENFRKYQGIFKGNQGLLNGAIMARDSIIRLLGLYTPEGRYDHEFLERIPESWGGWLRSDELKLKRAENAHGTNNLIRRALQPEIYLAQQPGKPHYFHEWDILKRIYWDTPEGERIAREAIEHILEDHMEFPLDEAPLIISNWTDWAKECNLQMLFRSKFDNSAREMLRFRYPEKFYPNEDHVWHDWDFQPKEWTDDLIIQTVKHNVEDPVHGEGWDVNDPEFPHNVNSWQRWFMERGLWGLLQNKRFEGSSVKVLKFVYPEKFNSGLWKESDFRLHAGRGAAKLFHYPVKLVKNIHGSVKKGFGHVVYSFSTDYEGFWVNKLNDDYAGLWKEEDGRLILVNVFQLIKHPGPGMLGLTIQETRSLFQPVPEKLENVFDRLAGKIDGTYELYPREDIEAAMQALVPLGITEPMNQLTLAEQTALLDILTQPDGIGILGRYLGYFNPAEYLTAIKVLASQADLRASVGLIGAFPEWKEVFLRYARIDELAKQASVVFGTKAMRLKGAEHKYKEIAEEDKIDPTQIREFKAEVLEILELGVIDSFEKANAQIMELFARNMRGGPEASRRILGRILRLQERLEQLAQMVYDFSQGALEFVREEAAGSIIWFRWSDKEGNRRQVRLVLRPEETDVEAAIRFSIDPVGMKSWAGFRIDRVYNEKLRRYNLTIDIDLGDEAQGLYDHHYPLMTSHQLHLANAELFSWLVRMIW